MFTAARTKKVERLAQRIGNRRRMQGRFRNEIGVQMRVLIVEDDAALAVFLKKGLQLEGHDVEWAGDGVAAIESLAVRRPELMVLDLGLPKLDGTEVLESLAGRFEGMSVLVLTGRNEIEVRVKCLNLGADDCMLKPFSFHELRARCRALLRRREQFADPVLRYGDVELHRLERRVTRDGVAVDLTTKEFLLLGFLMQRQGSCCTRAELLREVWQMSPDSGTNVVDVYVNYLRRKLGAAHAIGDLAPDVIETVRGEGYKMSSKGLHVDAVSGPPLGRKNVQRASTIAVGTRAIGPGASDIRAEA